MVSRKPIDGAEAARIMYGRDMSVTKGVIWGAAKVGKTSLLLTLPPEEVLVLDLECGLKAVEGLKVDSISIRTWQDARAIAAYIGGANPALPNDPNVPYSGAYYDLASKRYGEKYNLSKYKYLFIDSITIASKLCMMWCERQPAAMTQQGKIDTRKIYGLLANEMITWFRQLQHVSNMNVWFVGILDKTTNDSGEIVYVPQMDGAKTQASLAGIVDEILTLTVMHGKDKEGNDYQRRIFVTSIMNKWGFPAGDRSGCLELYEPAHLGKITEKINSGKRKMQVFSDIPVEMDEIIYLK